MVNNSPLITFIIPCYNVEKYLPMCLDSILLQQFENWEAIIVNDGSLDNSGIIADNYASIDGRIFVIQQSNQGVSIARNAGLEKATGKWIWFIDSDDYIVPNAVGVLVPAIQSITYDTIFFGLKHCYNGVIEDRDLLVDPISDKSKQEFLQTVHCYTNPTMLFSRSIIEKHKLRFTPGLRMAEDLEFQYKYLIHSNKLLQIPECLYVYQHRDGSATTNSQSAINNVKDCFQVAKNLQNYILVNGFDEEVWLSTRIRQLLKSAIQSSVDLPLKNLKKVRNELRQILCLFRDVKYHSISDLTLCVASYSMLLYHWLFRLYRWTKKK